MPVLFAVRCNSVQSAEQFIRGRAASLCHSPDKRGNCGALRHLPIDKRPSTSGVAHFKGQSRYPACPAHRQAQAPVSGCSRGRRQNPCRDFDRQFGSRGEINASSPLHISEASSYRIFPRANGAAPPRSTVWRSVPLAISEPGAKLGTLCTDHAL